MGSSARITDPDDPGDPGDPSDPVVLSNPTNPIGTSYGTCVAGSAGFGGAVGARIGGFLGVTWGGFIGIATGTAEEPGGGTVAIGTLGIEIGFGTGTMVGTATGAGVGALAGSILCSKGGGGQRKGERGRTAKPSGTKSPGKHVKPDPARPGNGR
jgi:hypothetical protein